LVRRARAFDLVPLTRILFDGLGRSVQQIRFQRLLRVVARIDAAVRTPPAPAHDGRAAIDVKAYGAERPTVERFAFLEEDLVARAVAPAARMLAALTPARDQ